jgi:vacuolar protein sorting-associated protein 8
MLSDLRDDASSDPFPMAFHKKEQNEREVFRWVNLQDIGQQIYSSSDKASSVLGVPSVGQPTVLAANGFICVGTDEGKIWVFDFKQTLKCICGPNNSGE